MTDPSCLSMQAAWRAFVEACRSAGFRPGEAVPVKREGERLDIRLGWLPPGAWVESWRNILGEKVNSYRGEAFAITTDPDCEDMV